MKGARGFHGQLAVKRRKGIRRFSFCFLSNKLKVTYLDHRNQLALVPSETLHRRASSEELIRTEAIEAE